uniref:Uncharacterized protein n=1 Tax=Chromera velia CCMP2878 TaxID=1169474 RepID=A0A0G4I7R1_9ALVE|eukprot:Cvel_11757.t1-p1 / transcript=Cvel_11757.t1 / gene=Cvel_11757 / organism=Chromera_velia_CCMP2878 / gene_product=hypothetical protein / transcript_product=hypothetical protein / location=Cvel_scaffold747:30017-32554(-) / protein_length=284 / sequence_SO=supercontig / SO=protein_coding / is_pseudo=false
MHVQLVFALCAGLALPQAAATHLRSAASLLQSETKRWHSDFSDRRLEKLPAKCEEMWDFPYGSVARWINNGKILFLGGRKGKLVAFVGSPADCSRTDLVGTVEGGPEEADEVRSVYLTYGRQDRLYVVQNNSQYITVIDLAKKTSEVLLVGGMMPQWQPFYVGGLLFHLNKNFLAAWDLRDPETYPSSWSFWGDSPSISSSDYSNFGLAYSKNVDSLFYVDDDGAVRGMQRLVGGGDWYSSKRTYLPGYSPSVDFNDDTDTLLLCKRNKDHASCATMTIKNETK